MRLEIMFDGTYDKLDKYAKMFSLKYFDYDDLVADILGAFHSDYDLYKFHLNLFNAYRGYISTSNVKITDDKWVQEWVRIKSDLISVSPNVMAMCLPLYVRKLFFDYDKYLGRFFLKCDLVYHLYN